MWWSWETFMVGNWFVSEVVCDGVLWWWWLYWNEFAEEFPVSNGHSSGAIDTYNILVKLADVGCIEVWHVVNCSCPGCH
jgi:hypothetical protein